MHLANHLIVLSKLYVFCDGLARAIEHPVEVAVSPLVLHLYNVLLLLAAHPDFSVADLHRPCMTA